MDENTPSTPKGTLYIVATPIGNLEDITFRALRTLKEVNLIAAEDTRRTRILLNHYSIKTPLTSYYEYNKLIKGKQLIDRLETGENVALVSDAGTPGISDPGYHLIKLALQSSTSVIPIPGVSAVITALSISGLPTDSFVFQGFLPNKITARKKLIEKMAEEKRTLVFYESPNRLRAALRDLLEICGDREIVVTRELTKIFEEVIRGKITRVLTVLNGRQIKGEITLLVSGKRDPDSGDDTSISQLLQDYRKRYDLPMKDLIKMISEEKGISKREVYQESLKLKKEKMFA
ncbi:MAG: 16S rRNA (cytidine(1402)-2'-O)-methyltransferase [Deltaproteobacteria bacterium]|jgi:16S rRNA (cytidine1402-2'-O)-methyltransferase|nr:MAG: 16S rRNA (cytidine(1402)-2'-O)-methyltransferase [Deltaproteobacteria bacterium]